VASLSAAIMAHPKREHFVEELQGQLDRDVEVVWDQRNDRWETGRRALLVYDPAATHHAVIQDDAVPCRDLLAGSERAAEVAGEHPISLYAGMYRPSSKHRAMIAAVTRAAEAAERVASPWMEFEGPWWGVGLVIPTADIPELVRWGDRYTETKNYDSRIGKWYIGRGVKCWHTMPSLVDHRPATSNPSLVTHDDSPETRGRVAHWFLGRDRSALEIDWNAAPLGIRVWFANTSTGQRRSVLIGGRRYEYFKSDPTWEEVRDDARALAG